MLHRELAQVIPRVSMAQVLRRLGTDRKVPAEPQCRDVLRTLSCISCSLAASLSPMGKHYFWHTQKRSEISFAIAVSASRFTAKSNQPFARRFFLIVEPDSCFSRTPSRFRFCIDLRYRLRGQHGYSTEKYRLRLNLGHPLT